MTTTPWPKAIGFFYRLLLTEHCTDPVCALQTHAYGFPAWARWPLIRIAATKRVYALLTMCCMGTALM